MIRLDHAAAYKPESRIADRDSRLRNTLIFSLDKPDGSKTFSPKQACSDRRFHVFHRDIGVPGIAEVMILSLFSCSLAESRIIKIKN
jgi:hypothetical protein